jgi:hypothetical protein
MAKMKPLLEVRGPRNIDSFVNGQPPAANGQALDLQPPVVEPQITDSPRPKMRGLVKRAKGKELARVTIYLEPEVALKLRRYCFENGLEVSEVGAKVLGKWTTKL